MVLGRRKASDNLFFLEISPIILQKAPPKSKFAQYEIKASAGPGHSIILFA
jgi:hypothetical protein